MALNENQEKAVNCEDPRIICLAGAGSGKTFTLISRISKQVQEGVNPNSILALTFTNAAGLEMKERFKKANPGKSCPEFRTFHAFCYSLICKDRYIREGLGYEIPPKIVEEVHIKKLEKQVKTKLGAKLSDKKLSSNEKLEDSKEEFERITYQKALKNLIKKENVITFDMLCYNTSELFVKNEPCTLPYKRQYKYIYCDEIQDTDMKQFKFLSSFTESKFFMVGDLYQQIYAFRGTTSEPIKALINSGDWTVIKLLDNYRSTIQICEYANRFTSRYGEEAWRIPMEGHRDGDKVSTTLGSYSTYSSPLDRDHMSMVVDRIFEDEDSHFYTAVLCRSNREVSQMRDYLTDAGIAITTQKPDEDMINILKSVNDNEYFQDWLASFLPAQTYGEYIKLLELVDDPNIVWFANTYRHIADINDRGKKVTNIRRIMKDSNIELKFKFEMILDELGLTPPDDDAYPENESDLLECVETVVNILTKTSVYVGTIHSSKGLEYDVVHVMGVDDKLFKLDTEEMENLFYVACTRAKNRLYIYRR